MAIKVGDKIRNNDPRGRYNDITVETIEVTMDGVEYATYHAGGRINRIRLDRIHTDGKPRHQGWSLVQPATQTNG